MCGVFGYIGNQSVKPSLVLEGLKSLEYRGYDSWGIAVVTNEGIIVKKETGKIGNATVDQLPDSDLIIGHTRWATHGGVTQSNAHPHLDCKGTIAIIHNGIVENYEDLKLQLTKQGHVFKSETDSEIIAHLLEVNLENSSFQEAFLKTFNQLDGLNAVVAVHNSDNKILAARKGSPLVIGFGDKQYFVASDPSALLPHTKEVVFLEDDQMSVISTSEVSILNTKTHQEVLYSTQQLEWDETQTEKGAFPHFMIKEIHEQPAIISSIASKNSSELEKIAEKLVSAKNAYFLGCGTASYAAIIGSYLSARLAKKHINWAVGSEFGNQLGFLNSESAVLALSQSGETMDILEPLKKAKANGASVLALVNVLGSSLYRLADEKVVLHAGPEKAVASTKALTAKIAHLLLLTYAMAGKLVEGKELVSEASMAVKGVLTESSLNRIHDLSVKIKKAKHIYVVGRGLSYPAALETALKIKEISYIHAEGVAGGELKHGPLALIEKGTPCIVLLPNDETYADSLSGAMEMKARGGHIIGVSYKPHEVFDEYLPITDVAEASMLPMVVTAQLLAYYLAVELGLDPDKPRNLAKSVTVK